MAVPALTVHRRVHRSRPARWVKSLARRMIDGVVERRLGIDCTSPGEVWAAGELGDSLYYSACDYPFLFKCIKRMELGPDDVAFEIGCGLGRALCLMARRGVKKCV